MKIRIKFSKTGHMRFVGHLDMMRYFQKAMRRSGLPIRYSEGFSPHQIMTFASPLSIGVEGRGEYMDIEIEDEKIKNLNSKYAKNRLNESMCEGMEILSFRKLDDKVPNAMACVAAADYEIYIPKEDIEKSAVDSFALSSCIEKLMAREEIAVEKKRKDKVTVIDIKPLIYFIKVEGNTIFMRVSQGSNNNVKPELFMQALHIYTGLPEYKYRIMRSELYTEEGITLEEQGEDL